CPLALLAGLRVRPASATFASSHAPRGRKINSTMRCACTFAWANSTAAGAVRSQAKLPSLLSYRGGRARSIRWWMLRSSCSVTYSGRSAIQRHLQSLGAPYHRLDGAGHPHLVALPRDLEVAHGGRPRVCQQRLGDGPGNLGLRRAPVRGGLHGLQHLATILVGVDGVREALRQDGLRSEEHTSE